MKLISYLNNSINSLSLRICLLHGIVVDSDTRPPCPWLWWFLLYSSSSSSRNKEKTSDLLIHRHTSVSRFTVDICALLWGYSTGKGVHSSRQYITDFEFYTVIGNYTTKMCSDIANKPPISTIVTSTCFVETISDELYKVLSCAQNAQILQVFQLRFVLLDRISTEVVVCSGLFTTLCDQEDPKWERDITFIQQTESKEPS